MRRGRREINLIAALGSRAPDPETAWFVTQFIRGRWPYRWLTCSLSIDVSAAVVWVLFHDGWSWRLLGLPPGAVFVLVSDLALLGQRRALRLNEPIARARGGALPIPAVRSRHGPVGVGVGRRGCLRPDAPAVHAPVPLHREPGRRDLVGRWWRVLGVRVRFQRRHW